jgi:iron complex outermembrane receptor protein
MAQQMIALGAAALLGLGLVAVAHAESADTNVEAVVPEEGLSAVAGEPSGERRGPLSIEELVVTARKRAENLLDTPVAVTAFSASRIQEFDIRRIEDITSHVPNLAYDASVDSSIASRVQLRGVGNGDSIATDDPGVGVYLDGVYLARAQAGLLAVVDVDRIEVLRGPQGALFGKNTIGGAVNIIPVAPDLSSRGGEAEIRVGNYDLFESRVSLNLPLIPERAAARFSFASTTRDGFTSNKVGTDLDDDKLLAFRAQLRVLPTDDLEINLALDHALEDRKPQGVKCKVVNPFPFGTNADTRPDLVPFATRFRSAPTAAGLAQQAGVTNPAQQLANLQSGANPFLEACAQDELRDNRTVASDQSSQEEDLRTIGTSSVINWDMADGLTLKSISSWRRQELDSSRDFDATPLTFLHVSAVNAGRFQSDQISQEVQLLGIGLRGRLRYLLGAFALIDKTNNRFYPSAGFGQSFIVPAPTPTGFTLLPQALRSSRLKTRNTTYAGFGQGTYAITDSLRATLGLRVTTERKQVRRDDQCQTAGILCPNGNDFLFGFEGSTRSKDLSPMATIQYALSDTANVYLSWGRSFKSGGFNGRVDTPDLTDDFEDERLTTYELGFKSLLWDTRVSVAGAIYDSIYEEIQLSVNRPSELTGVNQTFVTNAGEARIRGAELEARILLMPGLELGTTIGVTNARFTSFDTPAPSLGSSQIQDDPKDRQLQNTPAYTMNFGVSYEVPLGSFGSVRARTDWTHTGRSGTDTDDTPVLRKGKHGELDARLTWLLPDGDTEVVMFGSNLLDREYVTNGIDLGSTIGHALLIYNEPRTYGMAIRRRF